MRVFGTDAEIFPEENPERNEVSGERSKVRRKRAKRGRAGKMDERGMKEEGNRGREAKGL